MNEEQRKSWGLMLGIAKRNLSMPITDPDFRMAQEVFLAAAAELTRLREEIVVLKRTIEMGAILIKRYEAGGGPLS